MDFDMGKRAADLRRELRALVGEQVPEHFLGAFTDDPAAALASLERLRGVGARWVLPGHGTPWDGGTAALVDAVEAVAAGR